MIAILIVLMLHTDLADAAEDLPFETYSGYFVSNQFEPDAKQSFVVLTSQKEFDRVFGVAMVMRDRSHRLAPDAFSSQIVLSVIKRGNAFWDYRVKNITVDQGVIHVNYSATSRDTPNTTYACPLIVSVPKGEYRAVKFFENDKPVKTIELEK
jgi:hypothetical protein